MAVLNRDVPQWLLDIFNKVDFNRIPNIVKNISLQGLKKWADGNLKLYTKDEDFPTPPKRTIKKGFDEGLLKIINRYQYSYLSKEDRNKIASYLNNMIKSMPG